MVQDGKSGLGDSYQDLGGSYWTRIRIARGPFPREKTRRSPFSTLGNPFTCFSYLMDQLYLINQTVLVLVLGYTTTLGMECPYTRHVLSPHLAYHITTLHWSQVGVYHTTQGPMFAYFAVTMISSTRLYWCLFWHGMPLFLACYVAKLLWPLVLPSCYTTPHHTRSYKVTLLECKRKPRGGRQGQLLSSFKTVLADQLLEIENTSI